MSDHHTHDDCAQCLQKEVRRLQRDLDAEKEARTDEAFEHEATLARLGKENGHVCRVACISCGGTAAGYQCQNCTVEPCTGCGYSKTKHSYSGICPSYAAEDRRFRE